MSLKDHSRYKHHQYEQSKVSTSKVGRKVTWSKTLHKTHGRIGATKDHSQQSHMCTCTSPVSSGCLRKKQAGSIGCPQKSSRKRPPTEQLGRHVAARCHNSNIQHDTLHLYEEVRVQTKKRFVPGHDFRRYFQSLLRHRQATQLR